MGSGKVTGENENNSYFEPSVHDDRFYHDIMSSFIPNKTVSKFIKMDVITDMAMNWHYRQK